MSIVVNHRRGTTVQFQTTIKDFPDPVTSVQALIDPDTHAINIYDPAGVLQAGCPITTPTRVSLGIFYVNFTIPTNGLTGVWRLEWNATKGGLPTNPLPFEFRVI